MLNSKIWIIDRNCEVVEATVTGNFSLSYGNVLTVQIVGDIVDTVHHGDVFSTREEGLRYINAQMACMRENQLASVATIEQHLGLVG